MTGDIASTAQRLTSRLVDYLIEITQAAERDPQLDCRGDGRRGAWDILWLEELPPELLSASTGENLLRVSPPNLAAQPVPPPAVQEWLDPTQDWPYDGDEPRLETSEADGPEQVSDGQGTVAVRATTPPAAALRQFDRWLHEWRTWAQNRRRAEKIRPVYQFLERAAKTLEQQDDEYELVLARCLVRWTGPDGRTIRRHLVTEQVQAAVERGSAQAVVAGVGQQARFEDRDLFGHVDAYEGERAPEAREGLARAVQAEEPFDEYAPALTGWLNRILLVEAHLGVAGSHATEVGDKLELTESPALVLRPRPRAAIAEAYRQIRRELDVPDTGLAVALTQLVLDTEADQRQQWVQQQGGVSGDVLGADPRFPLDANLQQEQVMELLRTETTVVVQGPPGTGKTHTIANLMSALLARGQRVLVTSQKEQALRVLRDKVPPELRQLCVLLAGGSKDASKELQQSLEALSDAVAGNNETDLRRRAHALAEERVALRSRAVGLNSEIRELREVETRRFPDVTPWLGAPIYRGSLAEIVRHVRANQGHAWLPRPAGGELVGPPPFGNDEAIELHRLLCADLPQGGARLRQWIPQRSELPALVRLVELLTSQERAREQMTMTETPFSRRLAEAAPSAFNELDRMHTELRPLLATLGYDDSGCSAEDAPHWVDRALGDGLADRNAGLWRTIAGLDGEASRLLAQLQNRGITYQVDLVAVDSDQIGAARGEIAAGAAYAEYLRAGGKVRRFRPASEQRQAAAFLARVKVNGAEPTDAESCAAAVHRLEAEVATQQLVDKWADCGVDVQQGRMLATLSELADKSAQLAIVGEVVQRQRRIAGILAPLGLAPTIATLAGLLEALRQVDTALNRVKYERVSREFQDLTRMVQEVAGRPDACPELSALFKALNSRDTTAYGDVLDTIDVAADEKRTTKRLTELAGRLELHHPRALTLLKDTVKDDAWPERLAAFDMAWAWMVAQGFIVRQRTARRERELTAEYMHVQDEIQSVTGRLAATEALIECLARLTDAHVRALRTYREQMLQMGGGFGKNVRKHRAAARSAMEKAKTAVPAWVVPLSSLLENIPMERNSFDVAIIDEASQVGMEHLYLLWLAPRVIVVGDDKQCTPGEGRLGSHERIHAAIDRHLRDVDVDVRMNFTPKSNLYGLLSARSGKDAVIRLHEHFRCVPEIIGWSSTQFYGSHGNPGLIALRERTVHDLSPLVVRHVPNAYTEGKNATIRNPVEAKAIAEELAACVADSLYEGKTFGVVVLQGGRGQVQLLEHEIAVRVSPEERAERKIRVGVPSDFQGDERNVIFLSMVVTAEHRRPRAMRALGYQQGFNVAASRAEDQLWLFTSVKVADLNPDDLRASLLTYMMDPPSTYGPSPDLDGVSADVRTPPFESLLEQRVFREIRGRGFHVVPQYKVGQRDLDLVVVGDGARLAVECDGHRYHTSAEQTDSDARRDRELQRMKWEVVRVRESEFEFDKEQEMAKVWSGLEARNIRPREVSGDASAAWMPVALSENDDEVDGADE